MSHAGCDPNGSTKDDDSVTSERCWKEAHRGNSRKWLIRDASGQKTSSLCSTMKATYLHPSDGKKEQLEGARRHLYRRKLYEEIAEEVIKEDSQEPPIEEYCTEYDGNFNGEGFRPKEELRVDLELIEKYPLYRSSGVSYWDQQLRATKDLRGADSSNPFKRNSKFSKPLSEVLDGEL